MRMEESERGVRGVRGVHSNVWEAVSRQEVACAWPAGGEHAPLSFCPRRKMTGGSGGGLGRQLQYWAYW